MLHNHDPGPIRTGDHQKTLNGFTALALSQLLVSVEAYVVQQPAL